ncbi:MAG: transcriptional repressor [Alphaproteobacteria bacterium]|nr:MAG: transcriptional repressor [Alphaproteobacteria bacterium]
MDFIEGSTARAAMKAQLDQAAEACARHGARLTEIRRRVLGLIIESRGPLGAYALLDRLKAERGNATPVTVYRALDFLLEHGLVHKIERLNAFIACSDQGPHEHTHAAQFLICRLCGTVAELEDHSIAEAIASAANRTGFQPMRATIEVEGTCAACFNGNLLIKVAKI